MKYTELLDYLNELQGELRKIYNLTKACKPNSKLKDKAVRHFGQQSLDNDYLEIINSYLLTKENVYRLYDKSEKRTELLTAIETFHENYDKRNLDLYKDINMIMFDHSYFSKVQELLKKPESAEADTSNENLEDEDSRDDEILSAKLVKNKYTYFLRVGDEKIRINSTSSSEEFPPVFFLDILVRPNTTAEQRIAALDLLQLFHELQLPVESKKSQSLIGKKVREKAKLAKQIESLQKQFEDVSQDIEDEKQRLRDLKS